MIFYGRTGILTQIASNNLWPNIYGEPGIGKTALLGEIKAQLARQPHPPHVLLVNLQKSYGATFPFELVLNNLEIQITGGVLAPLPNVIAQAYRLRELLYSRGPFYIMFDSTDVLQENRVFWDRLEELLLIPFLQRVPVPVQVLFCGRYKAPLNDYLVKAARILYQIPPFFDTPPESFRPMISAHLAGALPAVLTPKREEIEKLVDEVGFGHPMMIKSLMTYAGKHYSAAGGLGPLWTRLCSEVLFPKVNKDLLKGVDPAWKKILKWAAPLCSFNQTFLRIYLLKVEPGLAGRILPQQAPTGASQWHTDIHPLEIQAVVRKDNSHYAVSECIRHFFLQVLLICEPHNLVKAYTSAAAICACLGRDVAYDLVAKAEYEAQAKKYRNKLDQAYREIIAHNQSSAGVPGLDPSLAREYADLAASFSTEYQQFLKSRTNE